MHLILRTGYSFGAAYGSISAVLDCCKGNTYAGICDRNSTWGHREWERECKKRNIKPLFGVELAVVPNMDLAEKQPVLWASFIAKNKEGLQEIYNLVALATEKFYYHPRIDINFLMTISDNVYIAPGDNLYVLNPVIEQLVLKSNVLWAHTASGSQEKPDNHIHTHIFSCNNFYPNPEDESLYQVVMGKLPNSKDKDNYRYQTLPEDMHINTNGCTEKLRATNDYIADQCNVKLPKAQMVKPQVKERLYDLCYRLFNAMADIKDSKEHQERLAFELDIINKKSFEDYFLVVYDLVKYARENMLVGAARGSSCGSLVCYVLGITTIDPLKYGLLFERFIDINRYDLPDIDIDFPDSRRSEVLKYLQKKYGYDCVAKLGVVSYLKSRQALTDIARIMNVPFYELDGVKNFLPTLGDYDHNKKPHLDYIFEHTQAGKDLLEKYPFFSIATTLLKAPRHSGVHAAGIVVTNQPLTKYCAVDENAGCVQIDKYDAERIDLLKIDVLGLRTLSVLEDTLKQVGMTRQNLYNLHLNDKAAFDVLNNKKFAGIFQFEGYTLQEVCSSMRVENFEDIAALTSLCRPGTMQSGGTYSYLLCRTGQAQPKYLHPIIEDITAVTYGVLVYQEQVMQLGRRLGKMSWAEVSRLRKVISKSKGDEIKQLSDQFISGCVENGLTHDQTMSVWSFVETMGAYSFNRSHAVAYAMMSYWCMYLKAHHPLQFACACLRHAKDDDQTISILRELDKEGYKFKQYDSEYSGLDWSIQDDWLIGGLTNIVSLGEKSAKEILRKKREGEPLTARQNFLITEGRTPFDSIFETREKWGHIYKSPFDYNIQTPLTYIEKISSASEGRCLVIAKIDEILVKSKHDQNYIVAKAKDDTGRITVVINRKMYQKIGKNLCDINTDDSYYLIQGDTAAGFKTINVTRMKLLTGNKFYEDTKHSV